MERFNDSLIVLRQDSILLNLVDIFLVSEHRLAKVQGQHLELHWLDTSGEFHELLFRWPFKRILYYVLRQYSTDRLQWLFVLKIHALSSQDLVKTLFMIKAECSGCVRQTLQGSHDLALSTSVIKQGYGYGKCWNRGKRLHPRSLRQNYGLRIFYWHCNILLELMYLIPVLILGILSRIKIYGISLSFSLFISHIYQLFIITNYKNFINLL